MADQIDLSVIVVAYNMQREIPRTLQSLAPGYQKNMDPDRYEVLVMDNGSRPPLGEALVRSAGSNFFYHYLEDPPPSPAHAVNRGATLARGRILCIIIDGAHIVTPGVLQLAMAAFRAFENPVVLTRYFYLGPGCQNDTVLAGYDQKREDALLQKIEWPRDGYRLFEIGAPFHMPIDGKKARVSWFNRMIESNCLFLSKGTFREIGGCDERFDLPGGGFLNIDICQEASRLESSQIVLLMGEGSFHQVHGGITTNTTPQDRDAKVARYGEQYRQIRGRDFAVDSKKDVYYLGHLPTQHSKIHQTFSPERIGKRSAGADKA
jgi:glycosyltransferase involved in cell wall biosynthesis